MAEIIVYTKDYCPYCARAKSLLRQKGQQFKEIDITNDTALQEEVVAKSGGRKTVPQVFIDGVSVGGCDDLYKLNAEGKLDAMLGKA